MLTLTGIIQRPASGFARTVQVVLDYGVSLKRLSRYMMAAEIADQVELAPGQKGHVHYPHRRAIDNGRWAVKMEGATCRWAQLFLQTKSGAFSTGARTTRNSRLLSRVCCCCCLRGSGSRTAHKRQNESQGENDEKDQGICKSGLARHCSSLSPSLLRRSARC